MNKYYNINWTINNSEDGKVLWTLHIEGTESAWEGFKEAKVALEGFPNAEIRRELWKVIRTLDRLEGGIFVSVR